MLASIPLPHSQSLTVLRYGRVSEHGLYPLCWSVGHAGPIANCVQDCALAYAIICGPDPLDLNTALQPPARMPRYEFYPASGLERGK